MLELWMSACIKAVQVFLPTLPFPSYLRLNETDAGRSRISLSPHWQMQDGPRLVAIGQGCQHISSAAVLSSHRL